MKIHVQDMQLHQAYIGHKLTIDGLAWKQINLLLVKTLVFLRFCQISVFLASTQPECT